MLSCFTINFGNALVSEESDGLTVSASRFARDLWTMGDGRVGNTLNTKVDLGDRSQVVGL